MSAADDVSAKLLTLGQQARLFYGYPLCDEAKQQAADMYQQKAASFWDSFYKSNGNRGVGNTLFPVDAATGHRYRWVSFDLSKTAIELVRLHPLFDCRRHAAFVFDLVGDAAWPDGCSDEHFCFAMLFFVLSAIAPSLHRRALARLFAALRPGGMLLFRDYHRDDHAQSRFEEAGNNRIASNFFVRKDGTQAYFFSADELTQLAESVGFQLVRVGGVKRDLTNRKADLDLKEKRIFLQAVLRKPVLRL